MSDARRQGKRRATWRAQRAIHRRAVHQGCEGKARGNDPGRTLRSPVRSHRPQRVRGLTKAMPCRFSAIMKAPKGNGQLEFCQALKTDDGFAARYARAREEDLLAAQRIFDSTGPYNRPVRTT